MAHKHKIRRAKGAVPTSMKELRRDRERRENRKYYKAAAVFFSVVIIIIVAVLILSSGMFYRHATAVKIDGQSFSLAEYNFYYYNYYYRYRELAESYSKDSGASLPVSGIAFDAQSSGNDLNETWKDYFEKATLNELARYVKVNTDAQNSGYVLEGDDLLKYEAALSDYAAQAENGGLDVNDYLETAFGKGVNYDVLTKCLRFIYTADAFVTHYRDELEIPPNELEEYYTSGREYYNTYNYMYFLVKADLPDRKEFETDEEFEKASEAALDIAKSTAESIVSRISTDRDMEEEAKKYDPEQYGDSMNVYRSYEGLLLGSTYGDWLMSAERTNGDMYVAGINTGYYVIRYLSVQDNNFPTADIRIIRIAAEKINKDNYADDENDDAYNAALLSADTDARDRAEEIFNKWSSSGGGETLFAEYASLYSDHIEQVPDKDGKYIETCPGEFPKAVDKWCFDVPRNVGDCEIVHSDGEHAYYIVYFSGQGRMYSLVLAENDMRDSMFNKWYDSIGDDVEIKRTLIYSMAMKHIPEI